MNFHKMKANLFQSLILPFTITAFCILIAIPSCFSADDYRYSTCRTMYSCGVIADIDYPFWGDDRSPYCGREGFQLDCKENEFPTLRSGFEGFTVARIHRKLQLMTIFRNVLFPTSCSQLFREMITFNKTIFSYGPGVGNLSLFYDCSGNLSQSDENKFTCHVEGNEERTGFYTFEGRDLLRNLSNNCSKVIRVPIVLGDLNENRLVAGRLGEAINEDIDMKYNADNESCSACIDSEGVCGSNPSNSDPFLCFCRDRPHDQTCAGMHFIIFLANFFYYSILSDW
ncbi:hypothetical protein Pint_16509 [Pistacia integerrima]|uniref:Uncharacterized protein n=1 Tax=Pistacia integerrima TaxID=434235 RepID=A0ACC0ZB19_9ROSI|nr:hypothetical protein Pint_16509 [Pistacia integerrima]